MFLCKDCHAASQCLAFLVSSRGNCEGCGKVASCGDCHCGSPIREKPSGARCKTCSSPISDEQAQSMGYCDNDCARKAPFGSRERARNSARRFQRGKDPANEVCLGCKQHVRHHYAATQVDNVMTLRDVALDRELGVRCDPCVCGSGGDNQDHCKVHGEDAQRSSARPSSRFGLIRESLAAAEAEDERIQCFYEAALGDRILPGDTVAAAVARVVAENKAHYDYDQVKRERDEEAERARRCLIALGDQLLPGELLPAAVARVVAESKARESALQAAYKDRDHFRNQRDAEQRACDSLRHELDAALDAAAKVVPEDVKTLRAELDAAEDRIGCYQAREKTHREERQFHLAAIERARKERDDVGQSLFAKLQLAEAERDRMKADIQAAAGELLIPMPEPGTVMAKMMVANRMMKAHRDEAYVMREKAEEELKKVRADYKKAFDGLNQILDVVVEATK